MNTGWVEEGRNAYPGGTRFELVSCLKSSVDILAEYSGGKTVCGVIRCLDHFYNNNGQVNPWFGPS